MEQSKAFHYSKTKSMSFRSMKKSKRFEITSINQGEFMSYYDIT